jgi:hypothetical protein
MTEVFVHGLNKGFLVFLDDLHGPLKAINASLRTHHTFGQIGSALAIQDGLHLKLRRFFVTFAHYPSP